MDAAAPDRTHFSRQWLTADRNRNTDHERKRKKSDKNKWYRRMMWQLLKTNIESTTQTQDTHNNRKWEQRRKFKSLILFILVFTERLDRFKSDELHKDHHFNTYERHCNYCMKIKDIKQNTLTQARALIWVDRWSIVDRSTMTKIQRLRLIIFLLIERRPQ